MLKILALFFGSLFIGLGQISFSADYQDSEDFTKEQLAEVQKIMDEVGEADWKALDAAKLYKQNCSSCHGRKGGLGLGGAANLKESKLDDVHKYAMVHFGKGTMKSYKELMKPAEIIAVSNFLETLKN